MRAKCSLSQAGKDRRKGVRLLNVVRSEEVAWLELDRRSKLKWQFTQEHKWPGWVKSY